MGSTWPLVGRGEDLERACALAAEGGVLIVGPPGVGKSRLAAEVMEQAEAERVVRVRATRSSSSMPLGAFAQALAAEGLSESTDPTARLQLAVSHLLGGLGERGRIAVWVDDVHTLDDTSATLLLHLALSGRADLVLTLRSGEPVPEPITVLWRDELVGRLDLDPLPLSSVAELLDEVLPGGVDGLASSALSSACRGNLLYLRELVAGLQESGVLAPASGPWVLLGPITAPPRLTELVAGRLASLSDAARRLLGAVALSEPMGIHGIERSGHMELVDELLDAGLVELVVDGRRRQLRALHPMHVEVARATMSEPMRRELLGDLITAIEATGLRRRDDARRLAAWRLEDGRSADPAVLVDAAREATVGADPVMAERFARTALESLSAESVDHAGAGDVGGVGPTRSLRLAAAHLLGRALDDQGRFEEAEEVFAAVEPAAGSGDDRTVLAGARAGNLYRGLARRDDAMAVLLDAESEVEDPALLDEICAQRGAIQLFSGEVAAALATVAPMLERSDDRAYCEGALLASVASLLSGRSERAIEISTRAFEVRIALGDQVQISDPGIHLVALALAQLEAGRIEAGIATARAGYDAAVSGWDRHGQGWMAVILSRAHLLAGRPRTAARFARESALAFGELRHPGCRWGFGALALAAGHQPDAELASDAIDDLDAEPFTEMVIMDAEVERGRAWMLVASGRTAAACEQLRRCVAAAHGLGELSLEAASLHDLARLGQADEAVDRLSEIAEVAEGDLVAARSAHADALVRRDAAALDAAASAFVRIGAVLFAAECAHAASAEHRLAGGSRAAASSAARAAELLAQCEGASTPAVQGSGGAVQLTRREHEVVRLAASGASNRQIADDLVVSIRTVENHLQRAYDKLGVRSREELAAALGT